MPECHANVRRQRFGFYGLLSKESIDAVGSERNLELTERDNQLFLGDRLSVIGVEIVEDCFQAEISFIDLRMDADHNGEDLCLGVFSYLSIEVR